MNITTISDNWNFISIINTLFGWDSHCSNESAFLGKYLSFLVVYPYWLSNVSGRSGGLSNFRSMSYFRSQTFAVFHRDVFNKISSCVLHLGDGFYMGFWEMSLDFR